jgi:hypothetical protein
MEPERVGTGAPSNGSEGVSTAVGEPPISEVSRNIPDNNEEGSGVVRTAGKGEALGRRMRSHIAAWSKKNGQDAIILTAIGLLAVLVLVIRCEGVSSGGDAIYKWNFVRQWFYKNDFRHAKWDHHMARFGVNAISYLVQCIAGRGPNAYFVSPIGAGVVQALFVYACGKRLSGRGAAVVSALMLIFFKDTARAASQILPEVFSGTYAIVAAYFYLRYTDAQGRRRLAWLAALSIALFWDYLAKETSVFFIPGFAVALWLASERMSTRARDIAILVAIFCAGLALETGIIRAFTEYPHRFAMVVENHIPGENAYEAKHWWQLFVRYEKLEWSWKLCFYFFLAASIGVVGVARNFRTTAFLAITFSYFFFLTFLVRGINPILLWQAFRPRYLDPTIPFVSIINGMFVTQAAIGVYERHKDRWLPRKLALLARFPATVVIAIALLLGYETYANAKPDLDQNALVVNLKMSRIANNAYRRNLPIVATGHDQRGVWVAYAVLIDDRKEARRGVLPAYAEVKRTEGRRDYLVRDPSVYTGDMVSELLATGCAITVKTGAGGPVVMRPMEPLPADCDKELEKRIR